MRWKVILRSPERPSSGARTTGSGRHRWPWWSCARPHPPMNWSNICGIAWPATRFPPTSPLSTRSRALRPAKPIWAQSGTSSVPPPTATMPGESGTVAEIMRHQAQLRADHPLLVCDDHRLSYGEADRRSAALARGLIALGAGKGTHVGLLYPNGPDFALGMLAA